MNRYSLGRYILILVLIVLGVIYALPNFYSTSPAVQISSRNSAPMTTVASRLKAAFAQQNIAYTSIRTNDKDVTVRFANTTVQLHAQDVIEAVLGSKYVIAASLADNTPMWLQDLGAHPMKLGLDLEGGIHFLLAVDVDAMLKAQQNGDMHNMVQTLRGKNIRYTALNNLAQKGIRFTFTSASAMNAARTALINQYPNYAYQLNKRAGFVLTAKMIPAAVTKLTNYAVDQNINTLRNRVNALGVAEPLILRQGAQHISVDLPGVQDSARAKEMIGKVATIRLQLQDVKHDAVAAQNGVVPFGSQLYRYQGQPVLLKDQIILRGSSIVNASTIMGQDGKPAVSIRLNGQGASLFNRITGENIGKPLAVIYVETVPVKKIVKGKLKVSYKQVEKVINIATIQSALGNNFQVTGLDSQKEAQNLAFLLRSGAYSAPVRFVEERLVGPSLGAANIHRGVLSTELGGLLVILFMALYYRAFGLIADVALVLNVVFIVAVMSLLGATMTLPGIAGIVLTMGMAVDANVLINERIREELRAGMTPQASIYAGYKRAFSTIVDANVTTLIVAIVLFALGSGSVQGFAVSLTIGLLTSMITAIFFTRGMVNLLYGGRQKIKKLSIGINIKKD